MQDVAINGTTSPAFQSMTETFRSLWDDIEVGAAITAYVDGEKVVDLWGGYLDADLSRPWQADSLANVYSATKGVVSLAIAVMVSDELLDYEKPVIEYWPEFGAERKQSISVAQLLSHQAGLYQFDNPVSVEDLYNWQHRTFQLAAQKPAWQPGSASGYHAITWGFLAGELIRRGTGLLPATYLRERLIDPLGVDCYIGCPPEKFSQCAELIGPNRARKIYESEPRTPGKLTTNDPLIKPYAHIRTDEFRLAEIPATNGHASARGLATLYSMAANGGVYKNLSLISEDVLEQATTPVVKGVDLVLNQPIRRSMGFINNSPDVYFGPSMSAFGHSGTGGSTAFADPENKVGFAYVMNQLQSHRPQRSKLLIDAFYGCL